MALGLAALLYLQPWATPTVTVVVETVALGPVSRVLAVNGRIAGVRSVDVQPLVSGTLVDVPVAEGDRVSPGQTLMQLDTAAQQAFVRQAMAGLDAALVAQEEARATLARARGFGRHRGAGRAGKCHAGRADGGARGGADAARCWIRPRSSLRSSPSAPRLQAPCWSCTPIRGKAWTLRRVLLTDRRPGPVGRRNRCRRILRHTDPHRPACRVATCQARKSSTPAMSVSSRSGWMTRHRRVGDKTDAGRGRLSLRSA